MGWFEDQVKTRKKLDAKTFEDSFLSLAGIRTDSQKHLSDEAVRENYAISQILSYFHHAPVEIPKNIDNFNEKLNYVLSQCDIEYHKVELNENYEGNNNSPLLIFTFLNNIPVVLFPKKDKYYFINYQTGKKVYIEAALVNGIELEAYSFYRPLPNKKVSIKEYAKYKNTGLKIKYISPALEEILKPTYGQIVYQEQVMQIASKMAGFSLAQADLFRRAISKKDASKLAALEKSFVNDPTSKGVSIFVSRPTDLKISDTQIQFMTVASIPI